MAKKRAISGFGKGKNFQCHQRSYVKYTFDSFPTNFFYFCFLLFFKKIDRSTTAIIPHPYPSCLEAAPKTHPVSGNSSLQVAFSGWNMTNCTRKYVECCNPELSNNTTYSHHIFVQYIFFTTKKKYLPFQNIICSFFSVDNSYYSTFKLIAFSFFVLRDSVSSYCSLPSTLNYLIVFWVKKLDYSLKKTGNKNLIDIFHRLQVSTI
ncbi:hypothetical protein RFI_08725 [Reticulomyxa filosa]|uniref:Uncharacterized protein n=1 Tax=Reticulomyxa filosa TaxID=46433 RepID=X6NQ61_RETFI|nr:hypothetical protein RFI_08725 [Reticulomyxa filosa]|eukprot:ETO28405.1 hypothetical protein RFI_08725 [Reticulomyxa filosa]